VKKGSNPLVFERVLKREVGTIYPPMDISEEKDYIIVRIDLPGVKKRDIRIIFEDRNLRIEGIKKKSKEEEGSVFYRIEREFGRFFREIAFNIPVDSDKISAEFIDGVLEIKLKKVKRKIKVEIG